MPAQQQALPVVGHYIEHPTNMKSLLTRVCISVLLISCNANKNISRNINKIDTGLIPYIDIGADTASYICDSTFPSKLFIKYDTLFTEDNTYSIGQLGKCYPQNNDGFKIGKWTEYYKSGNIKSQGNYGFGIIRNCCVAGYCYGQYSYKKGRWAYYYEDRKLKADILYDTILLPIESNGCGDTVYYKSNAINKLSRFFDTKGSAIKADSLLLSSYLNENQGWVKK
jgi:antitoxin component YwqK of YwqJK toxin-antitoxin module